MNDKLNDRDYCNPQDCFLLTFLLRVWKVERQAWGRRLGKTPFVNAYVHFFLGDGMVDVDERVLLILPASFLYPSVIFSPNVRQGTICHPNHQVFAPMTYILSPSGKSASCPI